MQNTDNIIQTLQEMTRQLRQDYLYMLLKSIRPLYQTLEDINKHYRFSFPEGMYFAFVLRAGSKISNTPTEDIWLQNAEEYIRMRLLGPTMDVEMLISGSQLYGIVGTTLSNQEATALTSTLFTEIQALPGMYTCEWTMGIGQYMSEISELSDSISSAQHAIKRSVAYGTGKIFDGNILNVIFDGGVMLLNSSEGLSLKQQIQDLNLEALTRSIPALFEKKQEQIRAYPVYAYMLSLQILQVSLQTLRENMPVDRQTYELEQSYEFMIDNQATLSELVTQTVNGVLELCGRYRQFLNNGRSRPLWLVITYLQTHFTEKITLDTLARQVDRNPQYLSAAFTREYGISMTDYITSLRMEKAKNLLRSSAAPINEIAHSVGYSDAKYFSRLFQRHTGVSPRAYQKQETTGASHDSQFPQTV